MKLQNYPLGVLAFIMMRFSPGDIFTWDPQWQFKQEEITA